MRCFDIHQHHGRLTTVSLPEVADASVYDDRNWDQREWDERDAVMRDLGIAAACILPTNSYLSPRGLADTRAMNDRIVDYCARDPQRLPYAAAVVEPLHGAAGLDELDRIAARGTRVVAYHPRMQGVSLDNVWIRRHMVRIEELGLIPFIHINVDSNLESTWYLRDLARESPGLTFVALDGLASHRHVYECSTVARECPNVLFDTSMAFGNTVALFADEVGPQRLLFGSDLYSYPVRWRTNNTPAAIAAMLTDGAAALVLYDNAARLFNAGSHSGGSDA